MKHAFVPKFEVVNSYFYGHITTCRSFNKNYEMKSKNYIFVLLLLSSLTTFGQDGKIIRTGKNCSISDSTINRITEIDPKMAESLRFINFYRITYSIGLIKS